MPGQTFSHHHFNQHLTRMKTVLVVLGAFALALRIFPIDASETETELPLNFLDLPVELRLDIFEQLHFTDLIRVSRGLPEDRSLIGRVFRNMLKNYTFRIIHTENIRKIDLRIGYSTVATITQENREYLAEISEFFQHFGHCITKLEIEYDLSVDREFLEQIRKQIEEYVAESVNECTFIVPYNRNSNSLANLIVPFPNARVVTLLNGVIDAATVREMFPAVRSLNLDSVYMNECLTHLPHLERLTIPKHWIQSNTNYFPFFEKTLELNRQLRHLKISSCENWEAVKTLNKIRPDIESLDILLINIADAMPIRFTNMKMLEWKTFYTTFEPRERHVDQFPPEFGNLEEIELECCMDLNYWINNLLQNKKLRKIHARNTLRRDHLERIADGLPNLEEFTMQYGHSGQVVIIEDIVDFLKRANQVKKATFLSFPESRKNECDELAEQLKNEWKNTKNDEYWCYFVRKEF